MKKFIAVHTKTDAGHTAGQKMGYNTKSPGRAQGMSKSEFTEFVKNNTCFPFEVQEID